MFEKQLVFISLLARWVSWRGRRATKVRNKRSLGRSRGAVVAWPAAGWAAAGWTAAGWACHLGSLCTDATSRFSGELPHKSTHKTC